MWWNLKENKISYFKIKINKLTIYVGSKPYTSGVTKGFAQKIDSWISVTAEDYPYIYDFDWKTSYHWFPLVESEQWDLKPYFFIKTLLDFYDKKDKNINIYLHCDLGSHRSPHLTFLWALHKKGKDYLFNALKESTFNEKRNNGDSAKDVINTFLKKYNNNDLYSHHKYEKVLVQNLFDEMEQKSCSDLDGYIDLIAKKLNIDRSEFSNYPDERISTIKLLLSLKIHRITKYVKDYLIWILDKSYEDKLLIVNSKKKYKLPLRRFERNFLEKTKKDQSS